jgi:AAA domain-containing protein
VGTVQRIKLCIHLGWATALGVQKKRTTEIQVLAQEPDVDWSALARRDPYSTDIAEGESFVGRRDKVNVLSQRLLTDRMQSTYITGQKRVGKTSLAKTILARVMSEHSDIAFLYLEYGNYACVDPKATLGTLGTNVAEFLIEHLPSDARMETPTFDGTLAPLIKILDKLRRYSPRKKFVLILDEFDELPDELYRVGALAEVFFANLRTLSSKSNLALILVGGEKMPFVVAAQGDQLNRLVREQLDYFSRSSEWDDYLQLVRLPVHGYLNWHDSAIDHVFQLANGHPYYTKLICQQAYKTAVAEHDAHLTKAEVERALKQLVGSLDTNSFAHIWKDGIQGKHEQEERTALQRCRLLVAMGRCMRQGSAITIEAIGSFLYSSKLSKAEVTPLLEDFCRRGFLQEVRGSYEFRLPLFREWLAQSGIDCLVTDRLGDELADAIQAQEDAAYVKDTELANLTDQWPTYRSLKITPEHVRRWLLQVKPATEQRLLFKLLQNVRFVSEIEVREKLRLANTFILQSIPAPVTRSRNEGRRDVLVTYVDGPAKSGHLYASRYAEENKIDATCVKEMGVFASALVQHENDKNVTVSGVVIVDDVIGTGEQLSQQIAEFFNRNQQIIHDRQLSIVVVVMCAVPEGQETVEAAVRGLGWSRIALRVCEPLAPKHFAFSPDSKIWASDQERSEAKVLCQNLGSKVARNSPLGYRDQGLLLVFPLTCPNNTLPILHTGKAGWAPLFERPKN